MSKATAKKAIDFTRLFELKEDMANRLHRPVAVEGTGGEGRGAVSREWSALSAPEAPRQPNEDPVIEVATKSASAPEAASQKPGIHHNGRMAPVGLASRVNDGADGTLGPLRLGLPRPMHERIRAAAAFANISPPAFVRDVLDSTAPHFERGASLANLAKIARDAFPEAQSGRRTVEVRMQVPMTGDLHQRLLQLAALRAQTLGACLVDLLEQQLPR